MKPQIQIWIIASLALAGLAGIFSLVRGTSTSQPAALLAQSTPSAEDQHIQQLREILSKNNLSEEGRSSVQEKLEMAERLADQQAAGKAARSASQNAKDPGSAASFWQAPEQPLTEGIFEGSQGLVRPSAADIANVWQGQMSGAVYQIFAGSTVDDSPRGLVIVVKLDPDKPAGERQTYIDPDGSARLRILEVQGNRLLLENDQSIQSYFNMESRTFEH